MFSIVHRTLRDRSVPRTVAPVTRAGASRLQSGFERAAPERLLRAAPLRSGAAMYGKQRLVGPTVSR